MYGILIAFLFLHSSLWWMPANVPLCPPGDGYTSPFPTSQHTEGTLVHSSGSPLKLWVAHFTFAPLGGALLCRRRPTIVTGCHEHRAHPRVTSERHAVVTVTTAAVGNNSPGRWGSHAPASLIGDLDTGRFSGRGLRALSQLIFISLIMKHYKIPQPSYDLKWDP